MFKVKKKKMIGLFSLCAFIILLVSESICLGQENVLLQQRNNLALNNKQDMIADDDIQNEEDYLIWKKRYEEVQVEMKKSKRLETMGIITSLGGMAVAFILGVKRKKIYFPPIVKEEIKPIPFIGGLVMVGVGAGFQIIGRNKHKKAKKYKNLLEEEGKAKGYLNLKVNPKTKSVVLSCTFQF